MSVATLRHKPEPGDILVRMGNGTVWVYEVDSNGKPQCFADSWSYRRARGLFRGHGESRQTMEAPDFTPGKMAKPEWAAYLLGKYMPDLAGRRLFIEGSLAGAIGQGDEPQASRPKPEVLPPDQQTIKPGVILSALWGYEQTNVDYYIVVKRKGSWAWLQQIGRKNVKETLWMQGTCEPDPSIRKGEVFRRKVAVFDGKEGGVSINSYTWASPFYG